jgi:hypothetical protein
MQKECKNRKDRELVKFFKSSMTQSESTVPDSSKIRRYFGISRSGSESGFATIDLISDGYKISTLFAIQTNGSCPRKYDVKFGPKENKHMFINNTAEKEVTLIGFVYEIEEKGWVKGIAISTGDENYVVETNEWTEKLEKEIENDVRVTGFVSRDPNGKNRILVTGYEVLYDENEYRTNYNLDDDDH